MGKAKRFLILVLLLSPALSSLGQEKNKTFQEVDRHSYELYQQGNWKELIRYCDEALDEGFDYYYLRLRIATACFETRRYTRAALHFEKALEFNEGDPVAAEYLYSCYLELNRNPEAYRIYEKLPPSSREKLRESLPRLRFVNLEVGMLMSNEMKKYDTLDLDGEDNIYGEADIMQEGRYFSGGLSWGFKNGYDVYGSYSLVTLDKNKMAKIGDTLSVDDLYPLKQHQVYFSGSLPLGKGITLVPAFNVVLDRFKTVMPQLNDDSTGYLFPVDEFRVNSYIGCLSVTKDFNIMKVSLFGAVSNLNEKDQYQGGFQLVTYPYGNLNLYLLTKLLSHTNDGESHIIFEQMAGFRLSRNLWGEMSGAFGRMQNYHDKNAFVVYNITDEIRFKGEARLIYMIYPHWMITLEYFYLLREGNYMTYQAQEGQEIIPVEMKKDFSNNIVLIGLKWKF